MALANYQRTDQSFATSTTAAKQRITAIYTNKGLPVPTGAKLDAMANNVVSQGYGYFDTIRANPARYLPAGSTSGGGGGVAQPEMGVGEGIRIDADPDAGPPRDFLNEARAAYPWLTGQLLNEFVGFYSESGRGDTALARLRQTSTYEQVFAGIKREDGSLRMREDEYFADKAGFSETLREFGLNPAQYESQYVNLFKNDVRAQEFAQAAASGFQRFVEPGSDDTGLFGKFLNSFVKTGAEEVALREVRDSSEYDNVFVGNRRADGTLRMDEPEFFAYKRGWQRTLAGYGLDPTFFEGRGRLKKSVEHEMSIQEMAGRLEEKATRVLGNTAETQQWYATNYNIELSREGILGAAIDPEVERDVFQRRIGAAQIGGEAKMQGFIRSVDRAEELARAGITQSQARQLYGQAGQQLPGLSATTRRFNRGDTSIGDFESAFALGDAGGQNRLNRALQEETATFGSRADTRRSRDGFGLSGLQQR